jgi:hypothetical protein
MKKIIIDRIEQFKLDEDNFNSEFWKNNYVSFTLNGGSETKHISDVDFELLNDDDLVRIFEYIILCKIDISTRRVNEHIFKTHNFCFITYN